MRATSLLQQIRRESKKDDLRKDDWRKDNWWKDDRRKEKMKEKEKYPIQQSQSLKSFGNENFSVYSSDPNEEENFLRKIGSYFYKEKGDPIYHFLTPNVRSPIKLFPSQQKHVEEITEIWNTNTYAISASPTGTGKTYITMFLYLQHQFNKIIVVGQQSSLVVFIMIAREYGIKNMEFITYSSLSCKSKEQKSGLVEKNKYLLCDYQYSNIKNTDGTYKPKPRYQPTRRYQNDTKKLSILLVFDEFHRLKNKSAQSFACEILSREIVRKGMKTGSRMLFLSATPVQREEHTIRYMNIFDAMDGNHYVYLSREGKTIKKDGKSYLLNNFLKTSEQIQQFAQVEDYKQVAPFFEDILKNPERYTPRGEKSNEMGYKLYTDVWVKYLTRSMIREPSEFQHKIVNRIVNISQNGMRFYVIGMIFLDKGNKTMQAALTQRDPQARHTMMQEALKLLMLGIQYMERGKIDSFARIARSYLESDPDCRVLIFLWLKEDGVDVIQQYFGDVDHLVLKGGLTDEQRIYIVETFQKKDGPRLLISTIQSGSESLSFHDIHGGRKRYSLISPSFDYVRIAQAAGRINRVGVKSDTEVQYVYGGDFPYNPEKEKIYVPSGDKVKVDRYSHEYGIIQNLERKEKITGSSLNIEAVSDLQKRFMDEFYKQYYEKEAKKESGAKLEKEELKMILEAKIELDEEFIQKKKNIIAKQLPVVEETMFENLEYEGEFSNPIILDLIRKEYKIDENPIPDEDYKKMKIKTVINNQAEALGNTINHNKQYTKDEIIAEYLYGDLSSLELH